MRARVLGMLAISFAIFISGCGRSGTEGYQILGSGDAVISTAHIYRALQVGGSGTNYYVTPSGSDSNPCTQASPCKTMSRVSQLLRPGDNAHFASGSYSWSSQSISVSGTSSARITFISDTKWGAKITGGCPIINNNGSWVDIVGFDVTGSCATGISNSGSHDRIIGNHVHNLPSSGGYAGILLPNFNAPSTGNEVIGNWVHDIALAGGPSSTIHGIYASDNSPKIYNNVVFRAAGWGIQLYHCVSNAVISNNTIFANYYGGIINGGHAECPAGGVNSGTLVSNNIVYANGLVSGAGGYGIEEYDSSISGASYPNNLVYNNGPANWNLSVTKGSGTNTITADPQFVNYQASGSGDYHLKSTSPAIDHGTSSGAPSFDYDNNNRPAGATYDIGAYEYNGTSSGGSSSTPTPAPTVAPAPSPVVSGNTVVMSPVADTFVRDGTYAANNYGSTDPLETKNETLGYDRDAYLKFDLSSVSSIVSAQLTIYASLDNAGSLTTGIYDVSDTTWSESAMTWNNKPALGSAVATFTVNTTSYAAYTVDLTSYFKSQKAAGKNIVSIAFHDSVSQNLRLTVHSRESGAMSPALVVTKGTATASPTPVPVVSGTTTTLSAGADAFVRDGTYAANNYGSTDPLEVKNEVSSYNRDAYLKFDLSSVAAITSAKLVVYGSLDNAGSFPASVYGVADTTWSESTLTWNNKPALGGLITTFNVTTTSYTAYTVDLTSYLQAQKAAGKNMVSIALHSTVSQNVRLTLHSRESATMAPALVVK